jgi:hypothetical protein
MYARCPQCAQPAQIVDRFTLGSTDGPVEHVKVSCRDGHWFTPLAQDVEIVQIAASAEPMEAAPTSRAA